MKTTFPLVSMGFSFLSVLSLIQAGVWVRPPENTYPVVMPARVPLAAPRDPVGVLLDSIKELPLPATREIDRDLRQRRVFSTQL